MKSDAKLKVLHTLGWYFPESMGGTEVYVRGLVSHLRRWGVESTVAAPIDGPSPRRYRDNGVSVFRYPLPAEVPSARREQTQARADACLEQFLDQLRPDVYHQHSWTSGCGYRQLRMARSRGVKTVLTVHVPNLICLRGTMMLHGEQPCDGWVKEGRCGGCWGETRGMPRWVGTALTRLPTVLSSAACRLPTSRISTALAWRAHVAEHGDRLHEAGQVADRVVAVAEWLRQSLIVNGLNPSRVVLSRQGVESPEGGFPAKREKEPSTPLHVGFVGRWDPVKGLRVLLEALQRVTPRLKLTVHALGDGVTERVHRSEIEKLAALDDRVDLAGPVSRDLLFAALAEFDVLAVPSQWLETGPYVAMEALAVGTPVLGSDLGGIRELVRDGIDGWLVPHSSLDAWAKTLAELAVKPELARGMGRGSPARVRSMADVADEMARLYRIL